MFDDYVKDKEDQKEENEKSGSIGFDSLLASMKQNNNNEESQACTLSSHYLNHHNK
jgi:hypothetical protein